MQPFLGKMFNILAAAVLVTFKIMWGTYECVIRHPIIVNVTPDIISVAITTIDLLQVLQVSIVIITIITITTITSTKRVGSIFSPSTAFDQTKPILSSAPVIP